MKVLKTFLMKSFLLVTQTALGMAWIWRTRKFLNRFSWKFKFNFTFVTKKSKKQMRNCTVGKNSDSPLSSKAGPMKGKCYNFSFSRWSISNSSIGFSNAPIDDASAHFSLNHRELAGTTVLFVLIDIVFVSIWIINLYFNSLLMNFGWHGSKG